MKRMFVIVLALTLLAAMTGCQTDSPAVTNPAVTEAPTELPEDIITTPQNKGLETVADGNQLHYYLNNGLKHCTDFFDESGRLIRREGYRNGTLYRVWEYEYTQEGDLEWVKVLCDLDSDEWVWQYGDISMTTHTQYQQMIDCFLDENGLVTATVCYDSDWSMEEARYQNEQMVYSCKYNNNDSIELEIFYENGDTFWAGSSNWFDDTEYTDTYFYDEKGLIQYLLFQDGENTLCHRFDYRYNESKDTWEQVAEPIEEEPFLSRKRYAYGEDQMRIYDAYSGLTYEARYDEQDRIVWERQGNPYGVYGEFTSDATYTYNEDGSYTVVWVGGTGGLYYSHYDKDGHLLESFGGQDPEEETNPQKMEEWDTYAYNESGDLIHHKQYRNGELLVQYRFEYEYDENGQWTKKNVYTDGELSGYFVRTYTAQGQLFQEHDDQGNLDTYRYNEAGVLVEKTHHSNGDYEQITYVYDEEGRLLEETCREDDLPVAVGH